eukprot:gb/GEZN01013615.1/.p1 GENE.gb/GEZN01013615.1/~~gb/GEZN01013615.1/.p1  ORF type:complete len:264 (+),score=25.79 gb/GEZN01013615.1/:28-819(+)
MRFASFVTRITQQSIRRHQLPTMHAYRVLSTSPKDEAKPAECKIRYPTKAECTSMPRQYFEMKNDALLLLSARGDAGARTERMIREVVAVDDVEYLDAKKRVEEIRHFLLSTPMGMIAHLPYKVGVSLAVVAGVISLPMVFHLDTATWFNTMFVTTDVPQQGELDTPLEIGMWTWGWNEPVMGTLSFVLLCAQFGRNQISNILGASRETPYQMLINRAQYKAVFKKYPQYHHRVLADFSASVTMLEDIDPVPSDYTSAATSAI